MTSRRGMRARARRFFSAPPPPTAHRVSLHGLTPSFVPATSTHPSTRVLEEVFASIARFAGAGACAKVIVADGVKTREGDDAQSKFRSGIVTRDAEKKYRHYLRRVKRLTLTPSSVLHGAQLLILDQRHGFAHALRRGICNAVKTPFVLVAQHDRSFVRAVDLTAVVDAMCVANEASPLETGPLVDVQTENKNAFRLNYVGFPTSTTVTHARHVLSKYALEIAPFEAPTSSDVTDASRNAKLSSDVASSDSSPPNPKTETVALLPLLQFYDSMHVASTRWYLSRVFGRERYCTLPKGGFIEDTLGQLMLRTARDAARAARVAGDAAEKKSVGDDKKRSSTPFATRTVLSARTFVSRRSIPTNPATPCAGTSTGATRAWRTARTASSGSRSGTPRRRPGASWSGTRGTTTATTTNVFRRATSFPGSSTRRTPSRCRKTCGSDSTYHDSD